MPSKHTPFYLLFASLCLFLLFAKIAATGMFMDGMLYNSVAHNLAHGYGSFWFPHFSPQTMPFFHEQPPLTFFITSLFYRAFGDGLWVDKLYTLATFVGGIFLLRQIWLTTVEPAYYAYFWVPLIFWLLIPTVSWSYSNCMEENTMSLFVLASVWLQTRVLYKNAPDWLSFLAGFCLVLGSLCKGFPGLFPLGLMGFAWLTGQVSFKKAVINTIFIGFSLFFCYALLYIYTPSHDSLYAYLNDRVFNSIKHVSTGEGSRFWIVRHAFEELLIGVVIVLIVQALYHIGLKKKGIFIAISYQKAVLFFLLALSGTVPLMATLEQRGFYVTTANPYFVLALALLATPIIAVYIEKMTAKIHQFLVVFTSILLVVSTFFVATRVGTYRENLPNWEDFFVLQQAIPPKTEVRIADEIWNDWDLQCALNRLSFVHFYDKNKDNVEKLPYFITKKNTTQSISPDYKLQHIPTKYYDLYKKE